MPHADSTAAAEGTITRWISRRRATSVMWSPAAPPKATSANRRGSTPRRPRLGPGALGPDVENSTRVHRRDRAAAGAERVDVDRRKRDLRHSDGLLAGELGLARAQEGDVRRGPAHVERDQVALAQEACA